MSLNQIPVALARPATSPSARADVYDRRRARRRVLANTAKWWAAALALVVGFAAVRSSADDAGMHVYGAGLEQTLFGGLPTVWIQEHVYSLWPGGISLALTLIHGSWFFTPFVAVGLVTVFRNSRLGSLVACWLALMAIAHVTFVVFPMEPPWMANPDVIRVLATRVGSIHDSNALAAMPSLHVALPLLFGLWFVRERWRAPAVAFLSYSVVVALEVVCAGEHYIVDVMGAGLASGAVVLVAAHGGRLAAKAANAARSYVIATRRTASVQSERGQALIELAFILPVMLVFLLVLVDFGLALDRREVIQHAAREGARYGAVGHTAAQIKDVTVNQSEAVLTTANVSVCYVDGPDSNTTVGDAGDNVRVKVNYAYNFTAGSGELLGTLGLGPPSITMKPLAEARLETPVTGATSC